MFTVYKITNRINGKCYIGSSIRVEKRWREHKNNAFNSNSPSYKYPLQCAIRKYGLENFLFEILNDNLNSFEEMEQYEYEMILYYNSYKNGYNQTLNTVRDKYESIIHRAKLQGTHCAKVDIYNNIIETYCSYHEAAEKNGMPREEAASHVRAVCKGILGNINNLYFRDLDEQGQVIIKPFTRPHRRKALICISLNNPENIQYYSSISAAAEAFVLDRRELQQHLSGSKRYSNIKGCIFRELDLYGNIIENSISIEDKIEEYNRTNPCINGIRHTITDWCKIYNITKPTYYYRIKQGMTPIEAITLPKRK